MRLYRATSGRLAGGAGQVLAVTAPGRRTGEPRSTCVRYLEHDGGYLVWGTASGASRDPEWFRNLRAAETVSIRIGGREVAVTPRELVGEERDRAWRDIVLTRVPAVARYERKAGRTIPVALLMPERG